MICFGAGAYSLRVTVLSWPFYVYASALALMALSLVAAVAVAWPDRDRGARWIFSALTALALFMLARGLRAGSRLHRRPAGWRRGYLDDVGFTLISLFEGFVIVAAIDLGAAAWLVVLIAVAGLVAGLLLMNRVRARLTG